MHIAIDALLLKNQNAGTGFYTHQLLVALSRLPSAHCFSVFVDARYQKASEFESEKMNVRKVKLRGTAHRILWEQLVLPKELQHIKADVALYPFFIKPVQSYVPSVVIIHDALIKIYPELIEPVRRWYLSAMIERSIRHATRIITVSKYARADIVKHYGVAQERISVVPAAAAPHFETKLSSAEQRAILQSYAVLFERFFLCVGISHRYKNYLELLRAFKAALEREPSLRLVMVGSDGNDATRIQAFIEQNALQEKVFRAKYVASEDLRAFYTAAAALVVTSQYESFCLPIVEAMQSGCPVIVANRAALPETAGSAGLMYRTEEDLSQALLEVWRNDALRASLVKKGYERAKAYSWSDSAKKTLAILEASVRA
ncbi:MAG: glycosyltransferase family 1 protein [Chloroherpetonaceae bacterium]|nr:glycosyltransferase family 4 protein [Chloroherpetonaceae bacterium]MDW8019341.1 glycosyltransferase family 1 protein [Chloroherpetonaceae bacterium]